MPESFCIVIPCHNEAARLDLSALYRADGRGRYVFVNDGSTDDTSGCIRPFVSEWVRLVELDHNVGKGEAIRRGFEFARRGGLLQDVAWIGFWDADMSTPLTELEGFLEYARFYGIDQVDGILGSRVARLGSTIRRSFVRHICGRAFATIVSVVFDLQCYDSQCGSKLFRASLFEEAFAEPFVSRWIFDVEILLRLKHRHLVEYPLRQWSATDGSKINVYRLVIPTLRDIFRIRHRYISQRR
jgi:dolichyl-phosphate beta-glucosyltransferase